MRLFKLVVILISLFFWTTFQVVAESPSSVQGQIQEDLVYTVQPGDTLILVALRYNLNPAQIALANDLSNPNLIFPGQQIILPGIPAPISTPTQTPPPVGQRTHVVQPGETIYSIADLYGVPAGTLITLNGIYNPNVIQAGQIFQIPDDLPPTPGPLESPFASVELSEFVIIQGRTLVINASLSEPATLTGIFDGNPLFFHNNGTGQLWAVTAIHALLPPGTYPIALTATRPDGTQVTRFENITVIEGPYGSENIQLDESRNALLDADLIAREREILVNVWSQVTLQPQWEGPFWYPVAGSSPRITSYFGTRRTYSNSEQLSFHGGTDFGGGVGTPLYAPAAGRVVLAQPLTVRGNAVLIDHGLGLYSGYWHQSQIAVTQGQDVERGDLIGYLGNTGLVTGPHLHWEMRLNGIAVNPLQWVRESIPQ